MLLTASVAQQRKAATYDPDLLSNLKQKLHKLDVFARRDQISKVINELIASDSQVLEKRLLKINKKLKNQILQKSIPNEEYLKIFIYEKLD